jgi:activator of HSP90 ATPase
MCDQVNVETQGLRLGRRQTMAAIAMTFGGMIWTPGRAQAETGEEISHAAEAIHQETVFKASRNRVYEVLTDTQKFDRLTEASGSKNSALGTEPTKISSEVGGAFVLFGGHIVGRQVELTPNRRIVQAWRVVDWEPGIYSIARFELAEEGSGTRIVFDHTGFPKGLGAHLAAGWRSHYWEPLAKLLT